MIDELREKLSVEPGVEVQGSVTVDASDIHFRFIRAPFEGAPLVLRFHGAVNRSLRPVPAFQGNLRSFKDAAHQITISDPTMISRDGFGSAWYAGHEGLDVQRALLRFIDGLGTVLSPGRVVFLGSSGGGFAALYCSYFSPGSIALVMVPQTNIVNHANSRQYFKVCWPGRSWEEVGRLACIDVTRLYSCGFDNTVIYVQSQGDFTHNALHLSPFLSACYASGDPTQAKIIVHSDYWGRPGHSGAVPPDGYSGWLRAAVSSRSTAVQDLLDASSALRGGGGDESMPHGKQRDKSSKSTRDLATAEMVKAGLLSRFEVDG